MTRAETDHQIYSFLKSLVAIRFELRSLILFSLKIRTASDRASNFSWSERFKEKPRKVFKTRNHFMFVLFFSICVDPEKQMNVTVNGICLRKTKKLKIT